MLPVILAFAVLTPSGSVIQKKEVGAELIVGAREETRDSQTVSVAMERVRDSL